MQRITRPRLAIQKTRQFGKYLCMNLWKRTPSYLTRPKVKYQYFRWMIRIFVESSLAKLFVFLTIYGSWSNKNIYTKKNLIFAGYSTPGRVTRPWSINFTIRLRLDFSIRLDDESQVRTQLCRYLGKTNFTKTWPPPSS